MQQIQTTAAHPSHTPMWQAPIPATQTGGGQQQWQTAPVASTLASENNNSTTPAPAALQQHHRQPQWHSSPEITVERVVNANAATAISRPPMVQGHGQRTQFPVPLAPGGIAPMAVAHLPQQQQQKQQQQQSGDWFWS